MRPGSQHSEKSRRKMSRSARARWRRQRAAQTTERRLRRLLKS